jgi:hypothetical protein
MLMGDDLEFQCSVNVIQEIMEACLCPYLSVVDTMAYHRCLVQQYNSKVHLQKKPWGLTFVDVIIVEVVKLV